MKRSGVSVSTSLGRARECLGLTVAAEKLGPDLYSTRAPNQTSSEHRCDEALYNNQGWHIDTPGGLSRGSRSDAVSTNHIVVARLDGRYGVGEI
jgi:hypothetical protein